VDGEIILARRDESNCALNLFTGGLAFVDHAVSREIVALADIVAARDAALRLASFEALAGLFLLVRGEGRLAAEFDAFLLGVGPAARGAFEDAPPFELRRHAEDSEDDLGKIRRGIEERFGQ
jgi:hypothetical protein